VKKKPEKAYHVTGAGQYLLQILTDTGVCANMYIMDDTFADIAKKEKIDTVIRDARDAVDDAACTMRMATDTLIDAMQKERDKR